VIRRSDHFVQRRRKRLLRLARFVKGCLAIRQKAPESFDL
jgi:hypothetical protein